MNKNFFLFLFFFSFLDFPRTPSPVYKATNLGLQNDNSPPTSSSSSSSSLNQTPQVGLQQQPRVFQPQPQQRSQLLQRQPQFSNSIAQPQPQQISPMYYPEPTLELSANFQSLSLSEPGSLGKGGRSEQWNDSPKHSLQHPPLGGYASMQNPQVPSEDEYSGYPINPYYSNVPQMYPQYGRKFKKKLYLKCNSFFFGTKNRQSYGTILV